MFCQPKHISDYFSYDIKDLWNKSDFEKFSLISWKCQFQWGANLVFTTFMLAIISHSLVLCNISEFLDHRVRASHNAGKGVATGSEM